MRVLIVEDELVWRELIREYVTIAVRCINGSEQNIHVLGTYSEAKYAIEQNGPWDLIIADIALGESGMPLAKNYGQVIITLAHQRKIPTIVVSGTISVSDIDKFLLEFGVIDCFLKEDFAAFQNTFVDDVIKVLSTAKVDIIDSFNRQNTPEILLPSTESDFKNGYALLIGIANYTGINRLIKTTADAIDIQSVLVETGYPSHQTRLLLDQQASKIEIINSLNWLAESTTQDDTVLIFFSGHGIRCLGATHSGEYLCPVETDPSDLENSCISNNELTSALRSIRAGRLAVLIDACHSGGIGDVKDVGANLKAGLSEATYTLLSAGDPVEKQGRVIIASCKTDEKSWELPEMSNGLFTH